MNYQNDGTATLLDQSNLSDEAVGFSYRDVNAEKGDRFQSVTNWVSDADMNTNPNGAVIRDGSRMSIAPGEHRAGDLVMINGMEIPYETAKHMGYLGATQGQPQAQPSGEFTNAQAEFYGDAENADEVEPHAFSGMDLLKGQLDLATDGNGETALNGFIGDVIENGELSSDSVAQAKAMGFSDEMIAQQYEAVVEAGERALSEALNTGDGLEADRVELLAHIYENGAAEDAKLVSQLWAGTALGYLSPSEIVSHFDALAERYA